MKKLTILGFIAALSLSLTACGQGAPIKDGVCVQAPSAGLPMPIDPDCGSSSTR